jgi:protein gp37
MGKTSIEWTEYTWNPIRARNKDTGKVGWHCEPVSKACRHCYAEARNKWIGTGLAYKPGHRDDIEIFLDKKAAFEPFSWRKPRRIFVCSMTDLFADFVSDEWLDHIFATMALANWHTFQVLTKRPERMRAWIGRLQSMWHQLLMDAEGSEEAARLCAGVPDLTVAFPQMAGAWAHPSFDRTYGWPLPNVWLGISAERQQEWDQRTYHLAHTPAAIRFVSVEPMLGPIQCRVQSWPCRAAGKNCCGGNSVAEPLRGIAYCERAGADPIGKIDWVIAGGESGPNARPSHPEWMRSLRDQCAAAGVAFLFKQWGQWAPAGADEALEAVRARRRARAIDIDGNMPAGDPMTQVGAKEILQGIASGRYTFMRYHQSKKTAGRMLDGRTWDEEPSARSPREGVVR